MWIHTGTGPLALGLPAPVLWRLCVGTELGRAAAAAPLSRSLRAEPESESHHHGASRESALSRESLRFGLRDFIEGLNSPTLSLRTLLSHHTLVLLLCYNVLLPLLRAAHKFEFVVVFQMSNEPHKVGGRMRHAPIFSFHWQ